jgi:glycosyltransferase involved in cell wall biosynthesis
VGAIDVLLVSLGSTAGLRAADAELAASLERAGASVVVASATHGKEMRTMALVDLGWALAARRAAEAALREHEPRAIIYSSTTAALLWPRPGAIRFDAVSAANRPGRHGVWQRPLERRRLREATLLIPWSEGGLAEAPEPHPDAIVVPVPVEPSGPIDGERDIAAITYAANPEKKGLDRVLAAWAQARREGEELVVAGHVEPVVAEGVRDVGRLPPEEYRALLRRSRVFVTAPRREDYGIAQLEALADGCMLVTTEAPGPYAALPLARELDPGLVGDDLTGAVQLARDLSLASYQDKVRERLVSFSRSYADSVTALALIPALLE